MVFFLRRLDQKESLAEAYNVLGNAKSELAPNYPEREEIIKIEGISNLTKAIELFPTNPELYFNRANAYIELQDIDKTLSDYEKALRTKPRDHLSDIQPIPYLLDQLNNFFHEKSI